MGAKEYFDFSGNDQKCLENDIFRTFLLFVISRSPVRVRLPAPSSKDARCTSLLAGAKSCVSAPAFFLFAPQSLRWIVSRERGIIAASEYGGIPEWPKGADCKSVVSDFGGSNPPSPTNPEHESVRDFRIFREKPVNFKGKGIEYGRLILPDPYFDPLYGGFRQSNPTTWYRMSHSGFLGFCAFADAAKILPHAVCALTLHAGSGVRIGAERE